MPQTRTRRVLIALTSHTQLGNTNQATGSYLPEIAHPWRVFTDSGYDVYLLSVSGGPAPVYGADPNDPVQQAFIDDPDMAGKISATLSPEQIDASDYDAIYFAGGHGTMWDFPDNPGLAAIARDIYERGGLVSAVCHGPAALVGIRLSDGRALVDGKELASFTNEEEAEVGLADVVPFLLQTRLEAEGAKHTGTAKFQPWVVVDGRLVTGQNPASAAGVAQKVVDALGTQ